MTDTGKHNHEWVDGFLFVGNHQSLDLLNTRLVNAEGPVELLPDTASLGRWLIASGISSDPSAVAAVSEWHNSRPARAFLSDLLIFREQLRAAVLQYRSGKIVDSFLDKLNSKLLAYPRRHVLRRNGRAVVRETLLDVSKPDGLWSEIAGAASDLFTDVPFSRVRQCEGCVVNFLDISKKGSRRWCSMGMCGNREKVANYRLKRAGA